MQSCFLRQGKETLYSDELNFKADYERRYKGLQKTYHYDLVDKQDRIFKEN